MSECYLIILKYIQNELAVHMFGDILDIGYYREMKIIPGVIKMKTCFNLCICITQTVAKEGETKSQNIYKSIWKQHLTQLTILFSSHMTLQIQLYHIKTHFVMHIDFVFSFSCDFVAWTPSPLTSVQASHEGTSTVDVQGRWNEVEPGSSEVHSGIQRNAEQTEGKNASLRG